MAVTSPSGKVKEPLFNVLVIGPATKLLEDPPLMVALEVSESKFEEEVITSPAVKVSRLLTVFAPDPLKVTLLAMVAMARL